MMKNKKIVLIIFVIVLILIFMVVGLKIKNVKTEDLSNNKTEDLTNNQLGEEQNVKLGDFSKIQVGDYVEYEPDFEVNSEWRVWSKKDNEIVIMPTQPLGDLRLGFKKQQDGDDEEKMLNALHDYNMAVEQIEAKCDKYTSSNLGITEEDVRSLTIEDVEKPEISELATRKYTDNLDPVMAAIYSKEELKKHFVDVDELKTYTEGKYFAARYNEETQKNEILSEFVEATEANPITVKQDNYSIYTPGWKPLSNSTGTYGDLIGQELGWLASPIVNCFPSTACFSIFCVGSYDVIVADHSLFDSNGSENGSSREMGVRPLVTIKAENLTTQQNSTSDGSKDNPWIIVPMGE